MTENWVNYSEYETIKKSNTAMMTLTMTTQDLDNFNDAREKEKLEIRTLNSRLENYINESREYSQFPEKLINELKETRDNIRRNIDENKFIYEKDLEDLMNQLNEIEKEKLETQLKAENQEHVFNNLRERIFELDKYNKDNDEKILQLDELIHSANFKIKNLENKLATLLSDKESSSNQNENLYMEIEAAEKDLMDQILLRNDYQHKCQSLTEELQLEKECHEIELKGLMDLAKYNLIDESPDWWNKEFDQCIAEIRSSYEEMLEESSSNLNNQYDVIVNNVTECALQSGRDPNNLNHFSDLNESNTKLQNDNNELCEKNYHLKDQNALLEKKIKDLKADLNQLLNEKNNEIAEIQRNLQPVLDEIMRLTGDNSSLQMQIVSYQKLLEIEESRFGIQTNHFFEEQVEAPAMKSERPLPERKSSYNKIGDGPVEIKKVEGEGNFIVINNSHNFKGQNLEGFKLIQRIDNNQNYTYTFDRHYLKSNHTINVCVEGYNPTEENYLVWKGRPKVYYPNKVITYLVNKDGKEISTFILNFLKFNH